jgi:hypothetical protein
VTYVLLVPPIGLLEVLSSDGPVDVRSWLADHGTGTYTALNITIGNQARGTVEFLVDDEGAINGRARHILARLTGVHVVLLGNVGFTGIHQDVIMQMIEEVG